ncbi:NIPSNAP family protein [Brucella intermedia]|uniref:NIPSNAP family protein n=1 Tax=Brucella intermedia TaxID=94625 RepID=UPI00224A72C4|nr:NIPSNAP family protein [Brucella intermedia]
MLYELITLHCTPLAQDRVSNAAYDWHNRSCATLLGAWRTEIGDLFQIKLLRAFESAQALDAERERALRDPVPYGVDAEDVCIETEILAPFPFLQPLQVGKRGAIYEFRTYWLHPGGLTPTMEAWRAALGPAAEYTQHLLVNLYALDGPPRILHIWGFESLAQRQELRARHYSLGLWPPKGGPQQIARANSTICVPEAYSPIH